MHLILSDKIKCSIWHPNLMYSSFTSNSLWDISFFVKMSVLLELAPQGLIFEQHCTSVPSLNQTLAKVEESQQEGQKWVEGGLFVVQCTKSTLSCCAPPYLNRHWRKMHVVLLKVHWKTYHWFLKPQDEQGENKCDAALCQRHSLVLEVTEYLADGKQINE